METNKKILKKIDDAYNEKNENGKFKNRMFFKHLIKAYMPKGNVSVAVKTPEDTKVKVRCVFSRKKLSTQEDILREIGSEEFKDSFERYIKSFDRETGAFTEERPMDGVMKGKVMAVNGKDTKTYMSEQSYFAFVDWVNTNFLKNEPLVVITMNEINGVKPKKKNNKPKNSPKKNLKKSTTSLGEFDALRDLKNRLEKEGK